MHTQGLWYWRREREDEEVEWKPSCVVHLTRPEGGDLAATRACFNLKDTLKTTFFVGSADGELVYADWIKPEVSLPCLHTCCCPSCDSGTPYPLKGCSTLSFEALPCQDQLLALLLVAQEEVAVTCTLHYGFQL